MQFKILYNNKIQVFLLILIYSFKISNNNNVIALVKTLGLKFNLTSHYTNL